jgi:hypothetical protein
MTMKKDGAPSNSRGRRHWRSWLVRFIGAATGLLAADLETATSSAAAQESAYRPAAAAPAAWQEYAKGLQCRFQQQLAANDDVARRFQDYMTKRAAGADAAPAPLVVRTWVQSDGKITRIEFDGLDDDEVAVSLRALLSGGDAGPPPLDMLQPLRLRLSLRPKDQPGQGE